MEVRCWSLLVLLVLAVSWRSEGVQNKHGNNRRLRSFHEGDRLELMMGPQTHTVQTEEITDLVNLKR